MQTDTPYIRSAREQFAEGALKRFYANYEKILDCKFEEMRAFHRLAMNDMLEPELRAKLFSTTTTLLIEVSTVYQEMNENVRKLNY